MKKSKVKVATARAGNVIGGGDYAPNRIIPDVVAAIEKGEAVQVRHPEAVRPWQHVLEPLVGYLILAKQLYEAPENAKSAYNFGPHQDDALPVSSLVDIALQEYGRGKWVQAEKDGKAQHEAKLLKLDISLALHELEWKPVWTASKAIARTINWHKQVAAGTNAKQAVLSDIDAYFGFLSI